jgi:RNA polymerase sigma-70 factor (ECF subfamily)
LAKVIIMLQSADEIQANLLRRIAARDRDALGQFYDDAARPLFSLAYRMLGNTEESEEVIQDAFLQIWNKAEKFDAAKGHAFHWALSITRNLCIDRLRARQRRARVIVALDSDQDSAPAVQVIPTEAPMDHTEVTAIRAAVGALPQEQREAIEMAFFSGLTHPEIASALQEPLGTVKARIRRGMLKLRDVLQNSL